MSALRRAYQIYKSKGVNTLIERGLQKALNTGLRYVDFVYQYFKPEYKTFRVHGNEAAFNTSPTALHQYDFTDDLDTEEELVADILAEIDDDEVFYDIRGKCWDIQLYCRECTRFGFGRFL
jgi:hypothetical protein